MVNNDRLLVQILLLALLGAGLWVMAPFISALLWGAILAFASWPLMRLLTRVLGGLLEPSAGEVLVDGAPLAAHGEGRWSGSDARPARQPCRGRRR